MGLVYPTRHDRKSHVRLGTTVPQTQDTVMQASRTSQWISENWERVYPKLEKYLSNKFPISKMLGLIDCHVSHLAEYLLKKDSLDSRLKEGEEVPMSYLYQVAFCKTAKQIEKWGTDASLRQSRGALTRIGVKEGQSKDHETQLCSVSHDLKGHTYATPEDAFYLSQVLASLEERLLGIPSKHSSDTYFWDLFQANILGYTHSEMAEHFGVNELKIKRDKRKIKDSLPNRSS